MRYYDIDCTGPGHQPIPNTPTSVASSRAKIGEVTLIWFRRIYGRNPDSLFWAAKGFMAGARDRRGNEVLVHQINDNHHPGFDTRTGRFPLCKIEA